MWAFDSLTFGRRISLRSSSWLLVWSPPLWLRFQALSSWRCFQDKLGLQGWPAGMDTSRGLWITCIPSHLISYNLLDLCFLTDFAESCEVQIQHNPQLVHQKLWSKNMHCDHPLWRSFHGGATGYRMLEFHPHEQWHLEKISSSTGWWSLCTLGSTIKRFGSTHLLLDVAVCSVTDDLSLGTARIFSTDADSKNAVAGWGAGCIRDQGL